MGSDLPSALRHDLNATGYADGHARPVSDFERLSRCCSAALPKAAVGPTLTLSVCRRFQRGEEAGPHKTTRIITQTLNGRSYGLEEVAMAIQNSHSRTTFSDI